MERKVYKFSHFPVSSVDSIKTLSEHGSTASQDRLHNIATRRDENFAQNVGEHVNRFR